MVCVYTRMGVLKKIPPVGGGGGYGTPQNRPSNWYVLVRISSHKVIFCWLMSKILQVRNVFTHTAEV